MSDLPAGWDWAELKDIARWGSGGTPKSDVSEYYDGDIPWVVTGDLTDGLVHTSARSITQLGLDKSSAKLVPPGTVLVAMYGASIGRAGIASIPLATNQAIANAQVDTKTADPKYVLYYLLSQRSALVAAGKGAAQPNIGQGILKQWPFPIAPRSEQEQIVATIEEQFSRLDAALTSLTSAQRRLEQLQNQGILALIAGSGQKRHLGEVADIRLGRQRSPKDHIGPNMVPYLRAANVTWAGLDLADINQMNFSPAEVATFKLQRGDVLVSEASGSATEVGKPALWGEELPVCCFQNTLIRLRSDKLMPEYLYYVMLALARSGEFARASKGVGIHHLSKAGLAKVMIEVPSRDVQNELVSRIVAQQDHFAHLEAALSAAFRRAKLLRSSILSSAFTGHLVPQDSIGDAA